MEGGGLSNFISSIFMLKNLLLEREKLWIIKKVDGRGRGGGVTILWNFLTKKSFFFNDREFMLNYWSIWSNCRGGSWPLSMNTNDPMQWLWKQTKISPQPLCLVDERPLIQVWEQFPVGPESLWDFRVVHLRVLLGHLSPLAARPDHESIHRSLDMVARLWSRTHHLLLEDGANWARTRRREPFLPLLAKYIPIFGLQLSWILDPLEPRTSKNKTLEFF